MKNVSFTSGKNTLVGNLYVPDTATISVLICHGAGTSNKERFKELQEFLEKNGIASLAFDFTGVGESGGTFEEGTLNQRLLDAQKALEVLRNELRSAKIVILGSS